MTRVLVMLLSSWLVGCAMQRGRSRYDPPPNLHDRTEWLYGYFDAGMGLPNGMVGAGLGVSPVRWAAFEVGGGTNDAGPQASGMAIARIRPSHVSTLGLAAGLSIGTFDEEEPDVALDELDYDKTWSWVVWSNTELQVRAALSETSALRGHFGLALPVDDSGATCEDNAGSNAYAFDLEACLDESLPDFVPYVGLGAEWDF